MFFSCAENRFDSTGMIFANNEQHLDTAKAFSVSHPSPPVRKQRAHKDLGRNMAGTAGLNWPKGHSIPYGITLSMQTCEKKKDGEISGMMMFVFQVTKAQDGAPLSWRWMKSCWIMGHDDWTLCFALPMCAAFAFPIKLSWSPCRSFLTLTILILSSTLNTSVELSCHLGLNHARCSVT